jgi:type II secretory pathway predicted ATPase ExeA
VSYQEFFQIKENPFSNAPDGRFYFNSARHGEAMVRLMHAARSNVGLALLVGDIGAGKTTVARRMLDELSEDEFESALLVVVHSSITPEWLLKKIAQQLGVEKTPTGKVEILSAIYHRLLEIKEEGRKAVVLVDEAQMLQTRELMEEFRGLLNLELPEQKLVTFIFFALTSIDRNLALDEPLKQRVALRFRLGPMKVESTIAYIRHRLKVAGSDRDLFTPEALDLIHAYSRGIPRLINVICDNSLFEAFLVRKELVDAETVEGAATDLGLQKVSYASGLARKIDPRTHPVLPPERLNEEEMGSLGLMDEQEGG